MENCEAADEPDDMKQWRMRTTESMSRDTSFQKPVSCRRMFTQEHVKTYMHSAVDDDMKHMKNVLLRCNQ
ncbi:hypothetical protein F3Y22_tig00111200pilonHSYRG00029 [Hibiscus syriacus]|uniref:Uncharacterized protein n=1 Tax=Hibiscus syriacus TaxID=106335 RepID=A0A6A2YWZ5_HIBSY|nr:hypothetical protein F3Y22_tig00111200pilonHSYRG00029 [Hibiscus syriacus]